MNEFKRELFVVVERPVGAIVRVLVFNNRTWPIGGQKEAVFTRKGVCFHVVANSPKPVSTETVKRLLDTYYSMLVEWGEIEK